MILGNLVILDILGNPRESRKKIKIMHEFFNFLQLLFH
jgi:hypothetical protein